MNKTENQIPNTIIDMGFSYVISEFIYLFLCAAIILLCLGLALIAYDIFWRITGIKVKGELYALLAKGTFKNGVSNESFSSIYKYTNHDGVTIYAGDNSSSNIIGKRIPGKKVDLYIKKNDIYTVHPASSIMLLWGLIPIGIAILIFHAILALKQISSTDTWLFVLFPLIAIAPKAIEIAKNIIKNRSTSNSKAKSPERSVQELNKIMKLRAQNKHYLFKDDVIKRIQSKDKLTAKDPYIGIAISTCGIAACLAISVQNNYNDGFLGYGIGIEIICSLLIVIITLCVKSIIARMHRKHLK